MSTISELKSLLSHRDPAQPVVVDVDPTTVWTGPASELQQPLGVVYVPPETILYQATVLDWLNVRSGPGIANPLVGKYAPGTVVDVLSDAPQTANGLTWWKTHGTSTTTNAKIVGWAASQWLSRIVVAPPTVAHKVGLHFLEDATPQAQAFLKTGAKLASATVIDNAGLANFLAQTVPYVLFRRWPDNQNLQIPDDATAAEAYGRTWVRQRFAADNQLGDVDSQVYLQLTNEAPWSPGHGGFNLGVLKELTAMGRHGTCGNYGIGYPEPAQWATLTPALQFAAANGHVACLHCYCANGTPLGQLSADTADNELRFVRFYEAVPADARPPLIIGEAAHEFARGKFEGIDQLMKFANLFGAAVQPYDYVKGFNLWTVGSIGGWSDADISSALTNPNVIGLFK